MFKRAALLTALLLPLLVASIAPLALAQGPAVFVAETRLPNSSQSKFPHVDTLGSTVFVSSNAERSVARLWSKLDSAPTFSTPLTMGAAESARSRPDYSTAAVFTAPDGTVHYAWINQDIRRILLRSKPPTAADFGPERLVLAWSEDVLRVEVEVAANEDGIFVFWREPDAPLKWRRSVDGGVTFSPTQSFSGPTIGNYIDVAAAAGRRLSVAYTQGLNDVLQGFVGVWNGTGFVVERIPTVQNLDFAEPSIAYSPDGTVVTALRSTAEQGGLGTGVYVADRAPNGTWSQVGRLVRDEAISINLDVDSLGNTHLFWISRASGGNDLWYTARRAGQAYGGSPLIVDTGALPIFNLKAAANLSDRSYGHAVAERFAGDNLFGQYFVFALPVILVDASSIAIESGQQLTNKPAVSVGFAGLTGNPTEVRWRWGAPPTDAANDSGGFKPLNNPLSVALPALANPELCTSLTLYTQLKAGTAVQLTPNSDSIVVDRAVQTQFSALSPSGAFDPTFTRVPAATLTLANNLECAGLAAATVSGPIGDGSVVLDVVGKPQVVTNVVLTGDAGPKVLTFSATDLLGNTITVSRTIIYDPTPPVLSDAGPVVAPTFDPRGSTVVSISLSDVVASDNNRLYGLSITPTVTPSGGSPTTGTPIIVPFSSLSLTTDPTTGKLTLRASVDLTKSLAPSALVPGSYDFVVRIVDAAGNESLANAVRTVAISRITYPVNMPALRR